MNINRQLYLVVPIIDGATMVKDEKTGREQEVENIVAYVHAAPIGREVFERYYLPIGKAFATIYADGLGDVAGPRVAALVLKTVSSQMDMWDGPDGVEAGLMNEIRRLANVIIPGAKGWETIPFPVAVQQNMISADDAAEVENAIVFFTVASAMHKRQHLEIILGHAGRLWGAQIESSNCTAFANSLPTSTPAANTGEKQTPDFVVPS